MTDIAIDLNGYCVNLRVGAIVTRGEEILLCRIEEQDWWFLPGGRIKTNESSLDALKRELSEEIGNSFRVICPVVCIENFFDLGGLHFHEICIFYKVEWTASQVRKQHESSNEVFEWMPRDRAYDVDLRPGFIKKYIINPGSSFDLIIHRDSKQTDAQDALSHTDGA